MELCPEEAPPRSPLIPVDATKTFENKCRNTLISIDPPRLKFVYHAKKTTAAVHFHTLTGHAHVVRVLPPAEPCFEVDVTKCTGLVRPGIPYLLEVTFRPREKRCYSDWLKVVCREDVNLMIPLEAVPYTPNAFIPRKVDLGCLVLGSQARHRLPIHPLSHGPVVFGVFLPEPNPDFKVEPVGGRLQPQDPPVFIDIVYTATTYKTVHFPVQLFMPAVSKSPFLITVIANCLPNAPRLEPPPEPSVEKLAKERVPLRRSSVSGPRPLKPSPTPDKKAAGDDDDKYHDSGLPWPRIGRWVGPGEKREGPTDQPYLGPFGNTTQRDRELYEEKRRDFMKRAEQYRRDNLFPPLKSGLHKPGQGLKILGPEHALEIHLAQKEATRDFEARLNPALDGYIDKTTPTRILQRTVRDYKDRIAWVCDSKHYDKDAAEVDGQYILRYQVLEKFVEAARSVLVRKRLEKRLAMLTRYRLEGGTGLDEEEPEEPFYESSNEGSVTGAEAEVALPTTVEGGAKEDVKEGGAGLEMS